MAVYVETPGLAAMPGTCGAMILTPVPYHGNTYGKNQWKEWEKKAQELLDKCAQPLVFATVASHQEGSSEALIRLGFREVSEWHFNYARDMKGFIWINPKAEGKKAAYLLSLEENKKRVEEYRRLAAETAKTARINRGSKIGKIL